jgi:hypothetical protein
MTTVFHTMKTPLAAKQAALLKRIEDGADVRHNTITGGYFLTSAIDLESIDGRTVQALIRRGYIYCADRGGWSFIETWKFNDLRDSEAGAQ